MLSSPVQERHRQTEESPEEQQNDGAFDIKGKDQSGTAQAVHGDGLVVGLEDGGGLFQP